MKRLFDTIAAALLLVLAFPLLAVCAVAVKVNARGPILFIHQRMGMGGSHFRCLKLRTMVVDAEEWLERDPELKAKHRANGFKLRRKHDPRVTEVGEFLRYTHLDELPQLINVLKGDMSLVGPRPIVEEELCWYGDRADKLLSVRPGVFGPWTAQGKHRVEYPDRVEVELSYVGNGSMAGDLKLILMNVPVLINGQVEKD